LSQTTGTERSNIPEVATVPVRGGPHADGAMLALALVFYVAVALVHTWPLALHLSDRLAGDAGDPALNTWILWWNATARPLSPVWWDGLGFWPTGHTLAFSEHLLGFAWLTTPIIWLGGSPALAHNVAWLISFPLSAWTAHLLVWRLTGRHDAGVVAGLAFGFAPIRAGHLAHLQVLTTWWMPVALVGLHEFWQTRRLRWLALFAAAWLLQSLSNNYYALFLSVLVALWLAWFGLRREAIGRLAAASLASVVAALPLLPLVAGYSAAHGLHGMRRGLDEAALFSADLAAFFNAPRLLWLWGWLQSENATERELFAGLTAVLLLVWATFARRRALRIAPAEPGPIPPGPVQPGWARPLRRALIGAGLGTAALALWLWSDGRERIALGPLSISTRHPHKTMTVATAMLAGAVALAPGVWRALRQRTVFGFYVAACLACLVLSVGPELRFLDTKILYRAPYALLFEFVPGFEGVRAPARFAVLTTLCLSIAAGLAFARVVSGNHRHRRWIAGAVGLALILEGALTRMPLADLPDAPPALGAARGVVIELPIGDAFAEAAALYRSATHRRRTANGYSGHEPLFHLALRDGLTLEDPLALTELASRTPLTVIIDRRRDADGRWQALAARACARPLSVDGPYVVMECAQQPRGVSTPRPSGPPLAIAQVSASTGNALASRLIDRDTRTEWSTNAYQRPGDTLIADLGTVTTIAGVEIEQGLWPANVPRQLEIAVSDQSGDSAWRVVWTGVTAAQTMREALDDPLHVQLAFAFAPASARYVRLRQIANTGGAAWSMAELRVLGPPAQTPAD
jgi:hypothetical protein